MSKYVIDSSTLTAIGDAVRGKDGSTDPILVSEIASKITAIPAGGGSIEIPTFSGTGINRFSYNNWNWFIEQFRNQIIVDGLTSTEEMFYNSDELETIPFDINNSSISNALFKECTNLKEIGDIKNCNIYGIQEIFYNCANLRYLPNFINCIFNNLNSSSNRFRYPFYGCYSLRNVPEDLLKNLYNLATSASSQVVYGMFYNCYALDEVKGLFPSKATLTSNAFYNTLYACYRVKDVIFATDNGVPYVRNWNNQIIDLSYYIGYGVGFGVPNITSYNS